MSVASTPSDTVDPITNLLFGLSRTGKAGSMVGATLDLVRSTGFLYGLQRLKDRRQIKRDTVEPYDKVYERIWGDAARSLGAGFHTLGDGVFEISGSGRPIRVWRQWTPADDPISYRVSLNRPLSHRLLHEAGLSIPRHTTFDMRSLDRAIAFLAETKTPGVLKPANGTGGGWCITSQIRGRADLIRAAMLAARLDRNQIIEEQIPGEVYRLLMFDGELLDVVHRTPPIVVGDGVATVSKLIRAENHRRYQKQGSEGLSELTATLDSLLTLQAQGLTLGSVPSDGRQVTVKTVTNQSGPDQNHTIRSGVCDAIVAEAKQCVAAVGLRIAGVDIVAPNLQHSLQETGGAIIEVNGGPGLHHHYHVSDRAGATPVAVPILRKLLAEAA